MAGSEVIAGMAIANIFKWILDSFGKNTTETSFKKLWEKVESHKAAKRYIEDIKQQHSIMQIWRMSKPLPLEGIFTHVNVLGEQSALRDPAHKETLQQAYLGKVETFGKIKEKRKDGMSVVQVAHRLFILGKPGAGKTTFLKYLTLKTFEGALEYVPIFVQLRRFADFEGSMLEFIVKQFKICDFPDSKPFLRTMLSKGKALILFDGLDEVPKGKDLRRKVIQKLTNFILEYDQNRMVITCRIAAAEYLFSGFTYVEMADFSEEQIRTFVTNWFKNRENPYLAKDTADRFMMECKEKSHRLLDLAKSPLLLTLLCIAYEETLQFSDRRSEIYEEALDA